VEVQVLSSALVPRESPGYAGLNFLGTRAPTIRVMAQVLAPSVHELLDWVDARPRTYAEAMEAWTSNCPRHPAWDDARSDGLIQVVAREVRLTPLGARRLDAVRRSL
jgi:hypothetical protein